MTQKKFCCINCKTILDSIIQLAELCEKHPNGEFQGSHQLIQPELPYEDPDIFKNILDSFPDFDKD